MREWKVMDLLSSFRSDHGGQDVRSEPGGAAQEQYVSNVQSGQGDRMRSMAGRRDEEGL